MPIRYSIIIPHYNHVDLLQRCIDSIPQRDDIEVIIVDDHSALSPQQRACFPGINRAHTQCIFLEEGHGAGYARNIGLEYTHGEWLLFADSDDFFTSNAFLIFDQYSKNAIADLIYFYSQSVFSDTREISNRNQPLNRLIDEFIKNPNSTTEGWLRFNYNEPWGKLIKNSLVKKNNILFEETRWGNDVRFSTLIGHYAHTIQAVAQEVYCVTVTQGSLVHQYSVESKMCRYEVLLRNNQYLRSIGQEKFQSSIMHSLRTIAPYGLSALLKAIKLGITYHANFFIGASSWIKNFWISKNENKDKEKYIIRN